MHAKILRQGEVLVVYLCGQLDYESVLPFRQTCLNHLYKEKVVFNCTELTFVGSKGITDFVETMVSLTNKASESIRFCGVSCEFRRILESSDIKNLLVYDEESYAKASFYQAVPELPPLRAAESFSPEEELS